MSSFAAQTTVDTKCVTRSARLYLHRLRLMTSQGRLHFLTKHMNLHKSRVENGVKKEVDEARGG